jgi:hypothetical protein
MSNELARSTTLTTESLIAAAKVIPEGAPFHMLNLLRYKERAEYPKGSGVAPCSGREAYHRGYIGTFMKLLGGTPVEVAWLGSVMTSLVAPPGERWDELAIVRYPSFAVFRSYVESPAYEAEAVPHRIAALDDWRLLATVKLDTP